MHVVVKTGFERRDMFIHFTSLDMKKKIDQCVWKFSKAFFPDTCLQTTLGFSVDACCQILFLLQAWRQHVKKNGGT